MSGYEVIMPMILLCISFLLKMSIDRQVNLSGTIYALLELPVDVLFLAASFIAATIISSSASAEVSENPLTLLYFISYIGLIVFSTILWRKSVNLFENEKWGWLSIIAIINITVTLTALVRSIQLV